MAATKIYFIEGNIGVGKTSVINYLKDLHKYNDNYNFITEPINRYRKFKIYNTNTSINILDEFYNKRINPFKFQSYIVSVLLSHILENIQENKINIVERSLFSAVDCFSKNLYQCNQIDVEEFSILLEFKNFFETQLNKVDVKIVYIKADPSLCIERIKIRDRSEETGIDVKYLESLENCHEVMIREFELKYEVKILDNNKVTLPQLAVSLASYIN